MLNNISAKLVFASFALSFSLSVSAAPPADSIDPATVASVTNKLADLWSQRIKVLDREMIGFRYDSGNSKFDENNFTQIQQWAYHRATRFFDPKDNVGDAVGAGIYLAVDPGASRSYGSTDPKLSVIKIKSQARLLDVASPATDQETQSYNQILNEVSCRVEGGNNNSSYDKSFNNSIGYFRNSQKPECAKIAIDAMTKVQAHGILYGFSGSHLYGCRSRSFAINMINPNAIEYMAFFSDKVQHDPKNIGPLVLSGYTEAVNDFQTAFSLDENTLPMPASLLDESSSPNYTDWKSSYLLHCGAKWSTESGEIDFNAIMQDSFSKYTELHKLLIQNKRAYNKLFKNQVYYDVVRVRAIERLAFEKTNLPLTQEKYNQWITAKELIYLAWSDPSKLKDIGQLLEEPAPEKFNFQDQQAQFYKELKSINPQTFDLQKFLYDFYLKMGFGPRLTQIMINMMSSYSGGPLIFVEEQKYIDTLKYCLSVYTDPSATPESVKATTCSVRESQSK